MKSPLAAFLSRRITPAILLLAFCGLPLYADADKNENDMEEVVVTSEENRGKSELGLDIIELSGDSLAVKMGATLGETLENELGVHNASYGPGVGLPVLRGLSGVRVHLSEDGIGAWDASSLSPDHATAIEPVVADSIQIVKGPASVLYGNNAIGGTVKVNNGRIAESLEGVYDQLILEARKELDNDHERESYVVKLREVGRFVWQADGFVRQSKDIEIPNLAIQEDIVSELYGIDAVDNTFQTVLNTDADTRSGSLGLSYVQDDYYFGVSGTHLVNEYGIPPGAHTEPADSPGHNHSHPVGDTIAAQARVRIDMEQRRHLFKAGRYFNASAIDKLSLTAGLVDYSHREFERASATGEVFAGTQFNNDVVEVKTELEHKFLRTLNKGHSGTWGIQWIDREFAAGSELGFGSDDYVRATDQQALGFYAFESFPFSAGKFELGGRYERQEITQTGLTAPVRPLGTQYFHRPITYRNYTVSSALTLDVTNSHSVTLGLSSAKRAPEIQELLSVGPHLATRTYDVGLLVQSRSEPPPSERFNSAEFRWRWLGDSSEMTAQVFYTRADDFIYQRRHPTQLFSVASEIIVSNCVRDEACIPRFDFTQDDVTLAGYEWQWFLPEVAVLSGQLQFELFADYVRAKISRGGNLPRIPPRRQGVGITWGNGLLDGSVRYTYVSRQNKPGENELGTDSYQLLNASIASTIDFGANDRQCVKIFLQMKNLLDEDIRKSTAFLRNFAPEPGREISLGLRYDL